MTAEAGPSPRLVFGGLALLALALVGLFLILAVGGDPGSPPNEPAAPAPSPARPAPRSARVPLPAPSGRAHPDPRRRQATVQLTPDEKLAMNRAVDDVLRPARERCVVPWLDGLPEHPSTELVFDAVLMDGQLADLGLRSLDHDLPADVVACVAEVVWEAEWPTFRSTGELRLQRSLMVTP